MNAAIYDMINLVVQYATDYLMPLLMVGFIFAVIARLLITITLHRQKHFVKEFGKRVHQEIMANPEPHGSFYSTAKKLLTRTYFETFELRARYKRRNQDHVMTVGDRVFLIQDGIIRADFPALKAADAGVFIENQFGRWFVGLGILAPGAG